MAEGTPIASLETGNVVEKADNALMNQILAEIGNAGGSVKTADDQPQAPVMISPPMGGVPTYSPHDGMPVGPPGMTHMPPGYMQMNQQMHYGRGRSYDDEEYDDEEMQPKPKQKAKKNFASSLLDFIKEPFLVAVLIVVLSLPVLHTNIAKYAPTLYSSGGMLSWLGLVAIGGVGAILFIIFRSFSQLIGL